MSKEILKVFNELIETVGRSSTNNEAKITNVKLWAESWKKEMEEALNIPNIVPKEELTFSTTGDRSSNVVRHTDPKTGKTQLWLEYSVYEFMEDTPENEKKLLGLHKSLWPSSGWVLKLKHLLEFVKSGSFYCNHGDGE